MAYSKRSGYFTHLTAKQSTEQLGHYHPGCNWFIFALRACITPGTKRLSCLICHPDYKTSQQEKVASNFWAPKWQTNTAPTFPLIPIRLRSLQWSVLSLLSRVVEFTKQGFWNVNQHYMFMLQEKETCKIKRTNVKPHLDLLRYSSYRVLKVLVSFPMASRAISSSFRLLIQKYFALVSGPCVVLRCSEELSITQHYARAFHSDHKWFLEVHKVFTVKKSDYKVWPFCPLHLSKSTDILFLKLLPRPEIENSSWTV